MKSDGDSLFISQSDFCHALCLLLVSCRSDWCAWPHWRRSKVRVASTWHRIASKLTSLVKMNRTGSDGLWKKSLWLRRNSVWRVRRRLVLSERSMDVRLGCSLKQSTQSDWRQTDSFPLGIRGGFNQRQEILHSYLGYGGSFYSRDFNIKLLTVDV